MPPLRVGGGIFSKLGELTLYIYDLVPPEIIERIAASPILYNNGSLNPAKVEATEQDFKNTSALIRSVYTALNSGNDQNGMGFADIRAALHLLEEAPHFAFLSDYHAEDHFARSLDTWQSNMRESVPFYDAVRYYNQAKGNDQIEAFTHAWNIAARVQPLKTLFDSELFTPTPRFDRFSYFIDYIGAAMPDCQWLVVDTLRHAVDGTFEIYLATPNDKGLLTFRPLGPRLGKALRSAAKLNKKTLNYSEDTLREMSEIATACIADPEAYELCVAKGEKEVVDVYTKSDTRSCMTKSPQTYGLRRRDTGELVHPSAVYDSPDIKLYYLRNRRTEKIVARTLVNAKTNKYIRIYGQPTHMRAQLIRQGIRQTGGLESAQLKSIPLQPVDNARVILGAYFDRFIGYNADATNNTLQMISSSAAATSMTSTRNPTHSKPTINTLINCPRHGFVTSVKENGAINNIRAAVRDYRGTKTLPADALEILENANSQALCPLCIIEAHLEERPHAERAAIAASEGQQVVDGRLTDVTSLLPYREEQLRSPTLGLEIRYRSKDDPENRYATPGVRLNRDQYLPQPHEDRVYKIKPVIPQTSSKTPSRYKFKIEPQFIPPANSVKSPHFQLYVTSLVKEHWSDEHPQLDRMDTLSIEGATNELIRQFTNVALYEGKAILLGNPVLIKTKDTNELLKGYVPAVINPQLPGTYIQLTARHGWRSIRALFTRVRRDHNYLEYRRQRTGAASRYWCYTINDIRTDYSLFHDFSWLTLYSPNEDRSSTTIRRLPVDETFKQGSTLPQIRPIFIGRADGATQCVIVIGDVTQAEIEETYGVQRVPRFSAFGAPDVFADPSTMVDAVYNEKGDTRQVAMMTTVYDAPNVSPENRQYRTWQMRHYVHF